MTVAVAIRITENPNIAVISIFIASPPFFAFEWHKGKMGVNITS
jgi:hypothetical protein